MYVENTLMLSCQIIQIILIKSINKHNIKQFSTGVSLSGTLL